MSTVEKTAVTVDSISTEAGEAMEWIDTQAAAHAVMDRMEERVAALFPLQRLNRDGERYVVERETRDGAVSFFVTDSSDGIIVGSARALSVGPGEWQVYSDAIADRADAAVAQAVATLLAASVAGERSSC